MDTVTVIRIVAGVMFAVIASLLLFRRKKLV
jgi:LPXTG-motif cell wall-anchored protein